MNKDIRAIKSSASIDLIAKAKELKRAGIDIIGLAGGEPDFDTPQPIKDKAISEILKGNTHYAVGKGILPLRKRIVQKLWEDNQICLSEEEVIVTPGAKMAIYLAVRACINAGDEVLIPTPSWVSYSEIVRAASGVPVEVPLNDQDNYKITAAVFEKYVSNKTTMLIINSPNNPTGRVLNEQEINELSSFLYKKDIVLLSDEVYEKILFDNRKSYSPAAYADLKSKTLTVNGFSKAYAMTGWRLGYIVGDKKYIEEINKLYTHTITGTPPFIQEAAIVALDCNEHVENMRREYQCRRDYFIKSLNEISGVYAHSPEGAFYAWAKIENRENLATFILDRAKVIGVPGKAYGSIWGNYIRFSFANKMDDLIETIKRLNTLLGEK